MERLTPEDRRVLAEYLASSDEILSLDPTDRHEGFKDLENWVEGSLDMYRVRAACRQLLKSCVYLSRSLNSDQYYIPYSAIFTSTS